MLSTSFCTERNWKTNEPVQRNIQILNDDYVGHQRGSFNSILRGMLDESNTVVKDNAILIPTKCNCFLLSNLNLRTKNLDQWRIESRVADETASKEDRQFPPLDIRFTD